MTFPSLGVCFRSGVLPWCYESSTVVNQRRYGLVCIIYRNGDLGLYHAPTPLLLVPTGFVNLCIPGKGVRKQLVVRLTSVELMIVDSKQRSL